MGTWPRERNDGGDGGDDTEPARGTPDARGLSTAARAATQRTLPARVAGSIGATAERGARREPRDAAPGAHRPRGRGPARDRKSTRLNSSHVAISYAVFCLKKKTNCKRPES